MKINRYAAGGVFTVVFIGVWILLDYLWCTFVQQTEFTFTFWKDLLLPVLIAAVCILTVFALKDRLRKG